jgi:hypothetical protein
LEEILKYDTKRLEIILKAEGERREGKGRKATSGPGRHRAADQARKESLFYLRPKKRHSKKSEIYLYKSEIYT